MHKKKVILSFLVVIICGLIGFYFLVNQDSKSTKEMPKKASAEVSTKEDTKDNLSNDPLLTLVNYQNKVPSDWQVDLVTVGNGQSVDRHIYDALVEMLDDAKAVGLSPLICSSYRTNEKQERLFKNQVNVYLSEGYESAEAEEKTSFWVARPGTSEHQMGFAVDIVSVENQVLDENQEKTPEQKWLIENCWKYGFILRYPTNKSEITKVGYEPWHYRYVGKEHAKKITDQGVCLEEYLGKAN